MIQFFYSTGRIMNTENNFSFTCFTITIIIGYLCTMVVCDFDTNLKFVIIVITLNFNFDFK